MNKNKVIVISVMVLIVLIIFLIIYKTFSKGESKGQEVSTTSAPSTKAQDKFTYKDMMDYRENNVKSPHSDKTKINIDEQGIKDDTLNFKIAGLESEVSFNEEESTVIEPVRERTVAPMNENKVKQSNGYTAKSSAGSPRPQKETRKNDLYNVEDYKSAYQAIKNQKEESQVAPEKTEPAPTTRRRREGFVDGKGSKTHSNSGISVISFGDQLIESGGSIKMRVTKESTLNGIQIPRNSIVYGIVSQGQNRLNINVSAIQVNGKSVPAQLVAYDASDGMAGLKVTQQENNNETESVKRSTGDEIINATGITSLPVIGNLTNRAKDLLSRKKSRNGIVVTDNYQLVLR